MLRRPVKPKDGVNLAIPPDEVTKDAYPSIWEYMTQTHYEDGSERQVATLLLVVDEGMWKACLNDRQEGRSMWIAGETMEGAIKSLDVALGLGNGSWRSNHQTKYKKK